MYEGNNSQLNIIGNALCAHTDNSLLNVLTQNKIDIPDIEAKLLQTQGKCEISKVGNN